jgi:hypothetical protein
MHVHTPLTSMWLMHRLHVLCFRDMHYKWIFLNSCSTKIVSKIIWSSGTKYINYSWACEPECFILVRLQTTNKYNIYEIVAYGIWRSLERVQTCRVPKTRGTHNERLRKTKPTGLAETANEMPWPCSDSYEARSTGRLDHVPTHTRLARQDASTTEKSPTRTTQGRSTHLIHQLWDKSQSI